MVPFFLFFLAASEMKDIFTHAANNSMCQRRGFPCARPLGKLTTQPAPRPLPKGIPAFARGKDPSFFVLPTLFSSFFLFPPLSIGPGSTPQVKCTYFSTPPSQVFSLATQSNNTEKSPPRSSPVGPPERIIQRKLFENFISFLFFLHLSFPLTRVS